MDSNPSSDVFTGIPLYFTLNNEVAIGWDDIPSEEDTQIPTLCTDVVHDRRASLITGKKC